MDLFEKTISSKTVFEGKIFTVKEDLSQLPNGQTVKRECVSHNGGVCVVALDDEKNIFLVEQYRYGVCEKTYEIPAGKLEVGEDPLKCGMRELVEETGYSAKNFLSLGMIYPTPAYCSEKIYMYLATELEKSVQNLDDDEFLNVTKVSLEKACDMVMNNEIVDAKSAVAILKSKNLIK